MDSRPARRLLLAGAVVLVATALALVAAGSWRMALLPVIAAGAALLTWASTRPGV